MQFANAAGYNANKALSRPHADFPCCHQQVQLAAQHISNEQVPDADSRQESWQELMQTPIDLRSGHSTSFVVIADPAFHRVTDLLAGLDYAYPEAAKVGGFVSSATQTAKRALFCWSASSGHAEHGIVKV